MTYDEIDSLVDKHREVVREAREQLVQNGAIDDSIAARPFEGPQGGWCELCLMPIDYGNCCPRCESYGGIDRDWRSDCDG